MSTRKSANASQLVEELLQKFPGNEVTHAEDNSLCRMTAVEQIAIVDTLAAIHKATRKLEIDLTAAKAEVSYWKQLYSTQQVKK